jgi:hypothetical protein
MAGLRDFLTAVYAYTKVMPAAVRRSGVSNRARLLTATIPRREAIKGINITDSPTPSTLLTRCAAVWGNKTTSAEWCEVEVYVGSLPRAGPHSADATCATQHLHLTTTSDH